MYKKLSETKGAVNEVRVDFLKKLLTKLKKKIIKDTPKDDAAKIEEDEKIVDKFERTLEFKNKIQSGQGLKILTPRQVLRRLPISLAQLNSENNSENPTNEIRQLLYSLYRSNKLTKYIYKSLIGIIYPWKQYLGTLKIVRQSSLTNLFISLLTNTISKTQITKTLDMSI